VEQSRTQTQEEDQSADQREDEVEVAHGERSTASSIGIPAVRSVFVRTDRHTERFKSVFTDYTRVATTFDLFGTLVSVPKPDEPARAIAAELDARGVDVPDEWEEAYRTPQIDAPDGAEVPLPAHVGRALAACGVSVSGNVARRATVAAFDPEVRTNEGAAEAIEAARERGPVGGLSNCSVPELVRKTLIRAAFSREFDAVVSSVGCGWRKPHSRSFEAVAADLGTSVEKLTHIGDSPEADGGIEACGGRAILLDEVELTEIPALFG
jgi:FMN phosphatase YigB (HAD superfamily)